jgi:subtilisin family serine protease
MAAPHVSGAAAILLSVGLSPQQTVDRLLATARDIGPAGDDSTFGHGLLDIAAATAGFARTTPTSTPPPAGRTTTTSPERTSAESSGGGAPTGSPTPSTPAFTTPGSPEIRDPTPVDDDLLSGDALGEDGGGGGVPGALGALAATMVMASAGASVLVARRQRWQLPRRSS